MAQPRVFKFTDFNTVDEVFSFIKKYPNDNITFDYSGVSYGDGANAHILVKLANNLIDLHLCKKNIYFADILETSKFWKNDANIRAFSKFLYLMVNNETKLPYHLPLPLLECIVDRKMTEEELKYFFSWTDLPNSFGEKLLPKILAYSPEDLQSIECDTPFDAIADILCSNFMGDITVYQKIARFFNNLHPKKYENVKELDDLISAANHITVDDILKTLKIENDPDGIYIQIFTEFLDTLNADERKILFESYNVYLSTDIEFTIRIEDCILVYNKDGNVIKGFSKDVEITTCLKLIKIRRSLFHGIGHKTSFFQDANSNVFVALKEALIHKNSETLVDEMYVPPEIRNNPMAFAPRIIPVQISPGQLGRLLNSGNIDNELNNLLNDAIQTFGNGVFGPSPTNGRNRGDRLNNESDDIPSLEETIPVDDKSSEVSSDGNPSAEDRRVNPTRENPYRDNPPNNNNQFVQNLEAMLMNMSQERSLWVSPQGVSPQVPRAHRAERNPEEIFTQMFPRSPDMDEASYEIMKQMMWEEYLMNEPR